MTTQPQRFDSVRQMMSSVMTRTIPTSCMIYTSAAQEGHAAGPSKELTSCRHSRTGPVAHDYVRPCPSNISVDTCRRGEGGDWPVFPRCRVLMSCRRARLDESVTLLCTTPLDSGIFDPRWGWHMLKTWVCIGPCIGYVRSRATLPATSRELHW